MVDKKSPVKRQTVAKSTRAPRSKKLNLDKLLISIKKISTRYNKNGKMTGGAPDLSIDKAIEEIKKFFDVNNPKTLLGRSGGETTLTKVLTEIDKICTNDTNDTNKEDLLSDIKTILQDTAPPSSVSATTPDTRSGAPIEALVPLSLSDPAITDSLTYYVNNNSDEKSNINSYDKNVEKYFEKRIGWFNNILNSKNFIPPKFKYNIDNSKLFTSGQKKALAYISIFQIAHTLANIYHVLIIFKNNST